MSRLKSSSSSKSDREIVIRVQLMLAMASVERSERSKMDISPKHAPGLRTASASSPEPGMVREMRTSPSEIMKRRFPGSPPFDMFCPQLDFFSGHTPEKRGRAPASRAREMAARFQQIRSTRGNFLGAWGGV